jgi:hypothetical protein
MLNEYRINPLQLKHFNTKFYNVGAREFEKMDKHPLYRQCELKRFMHKTTTDPIELMIRYRPGSFRKFLNK